MFENRDLEPVTLPERYRVALEKAGVSPSDIAYTRIHFMKDNAIVPYMFYPTAGGKVKD